MNLEHELRQALRPTNPSPGFDARVLASIASGGRVEEPPRRRSAWARRMLPLAAALAVMAGGSYAIYLERQEQRQTERAARDVVVALQIASEKVSAVQVKVQEISHHERQSPR